MAARGTARRLATQQPTYNFLGGPDTNNENRPPPDAPSSAPRSRRGSLRQSLLPQPVTAVADIGNEQLRAQLKALQYEVDSYKQQRELARVQHEKELRDVQAQAETDFKKAQTANSSRNMTTHRFESLQRELKELQDRSTNAQHDLEKKWRTAQDTNRTIKEELDEAQSELSSSERQHKHQLQELDKKHDSLQKTVQELRHDLEAKAAGYDSAQAKLKARDAEFGKLESEVLEVRANGGAKDEIEAVRSQLSEQVEHIRNLEISNREQGAELRKLRETNRSTAVLEEQKASLEKRLLRIDELERELGESQFQRELLQNERKAWSSYLQEVAGEGVSPGFDTPEAVARALHGERLEKASLLEQLGSLQPELLEKDAVITQLQQENERIKVEAASSTTSAAASNSSTEQRARARLEKQKALAIKEVEYLRAQLKTFEAEEEITGEIDVSGPDATTKHRIAELEDLVAQYRQELAKASIDLARRPQSQPIEPQTPTLKRPRDPESTNADSGYESSEQLSNLSRKTRKLQLELSEVTKQAKQLEADKIALQAQLESLRKASKTRVLSLRNNPTDDFEARKFSTIQTLRKENKALLTQLESSTKTKPSTKDRLVPAASIDAVRAEVEEAELRVKDKETTIARLKTVFNAKSLEMREAIASLLGWNMEFVPNGRFKLTSIFSDDALEPGQEKVERSITFHGEKGTMHIAGGSNGVFGQEIGGVVDYWVQERGEIPGFLAAYTIEVLEKVREEKERQAAEGEGERRVKKKRKV